MEYDISDEIEKENCRQEQESQKRDEKTAKLLESIKNNRFMASNYDEIAKSIRRFGAIQGLVIYAASVMSDVQEGMNFGQDKETLRQWCNLAKGCMFAIEDYCDPDRHTRKIGEPIPYF